MSKIKKRSDELTCRNLTICKLVFKGRTISQVSKMFEISTTRVRQIITKYISQGFYSLVIEQQKSLPLMERVRSWQSICHHKSYMSDSDDLLECVYHDLESLKC